MTDLDLYRTGEYKYLKPVERLAEIRLENVYWLERGDGQQGLRTTRYHPSLKHKPVNLSQVWTIFNDLQEPQVSKHWPWLATLSLFVQSNKTKWMDCTQSFSVGHLLSLLPGLLLVHEVSTLASDWPIPQVYPSIICTDIAVSVDPIISYEDFQFLLLGKIYTKFVPNIFYWRSFITIISPGLSVHCKQILSSKSEN